MDPPRLDKFSLTYTSCYCEENIYHLCRKLPTEKCHVIFIANVFKSAPVWMQRAWEMDHDDSPALWDYHVILVYKPSDGSPCWVYDLDTLLPFPCPFNEYVERALRPERIIGVERWQRKYRVTPAPTYLTTFASDRSHMVKSDGTWNSPAPSYEVIVAGERTMTLPHFISVTANLSSADYGNVYAENDFIRIFS